MHLLGKRIILCLVYVCSSVCLFSWFPDFAFCLCFPRSGILWQVSFKLNISFYLSTTEVNFENCFIFSTGRYVSKWIWRYLFRSRERQVSFSSLFLQWSEPYTFCFASLAYRIDDFALLLSPFPTLRTPSTQAKCSWSLHAFHVLCLSKCFVFLLFIGMVMVYLMAMTTVLISQMANKQMLMTTK